MPPPYILKPLHAEYRAGRRYELMAPFVYVSAIPGVGTITVPEGRITDFHTVPWWLWSVLPPDDWAEAGVAHDELYLTGRSDDGPVTQEQADLVHHECLIHIGAPIERADVMLEGLRLGGFVAWDAYRRRDSCCS